MKQIFRPFWLLALPIVLSFASCFTEDRPVAPDSGLAGKIQGK